MPPDKKNENPKEKDWAGRTFGGIIQSPVFVSFVLGLAATLSFWPVVHAGFINYDDNEYITANPMVLRGFSWEGVRWAFTTRHASNWHPLTWLSHMLDVALFGKDATGPHCVNLALHVANTLLCFWLLRRLTGAHWKSAFVAGLFALHPLHVESVAWVAERKDVLSAFFFLLTLWAYARYVGLKVQRPTPINREQASKGQGLRWYASGLLLFALGLMSKPMLVTLPFVLLLLDYWPLKRNAESGASTRFQVWRRLLVEKIPFFALSAGACAATLWAQQQAIQPLEHLRLSDRIGNAVVAYAGYVWKMIWPVDLALPYLHPGHWPAIRVAGALVLLVLLTIVAVGGRTRNGYLMTGWLWFLGTLVPVIGIVQVGTQAMADRYTYVPLMGLFIAAVWALSDLCKRWSPGRVAVPLAGTLILIICSALTVRQAGYWENSERLFKHADAVTEGNFIAAANVGGVFFESRRLDEAMEWYQRSYQMNPRYPEAVNSIGAVLAANGSDEAMEWFRKALEVQPLHPQALFNMGNALAKRGNTAEAASYYEAAVRAKPDNHEARNNLGNALMKLHRFDEAIEQYKAALLYRPQEPMVWKNLGEALAAKGKLDEAVGEYHRALAFTNDPATHYSLGLTLAVQAKWDAAIEQFAETLKLLPTNAEAHYNLGYALVMKGKSDQAEGQFRAALQFRPEFPIAHYNLGCVLAEQGRKQEAITHLTEALRQNPDYTEAREKIRVLGEKPE